MIQAAETEKIYLIPIKDGEDSKWIQTQEIPVTRTRLLVNGFTHLTFAAESLRIMAGGETVELAGMRIKVQMTFTLERATNALQNPNPYPRATFDIEQLGKYFSPRV